MSSLSAPQVPKKRRRYTKAFKARIVTFCQQPGASVSRVALDHGLNAKLVRRWIKLAENRPSKTPSFVPIPLTATHSTPAYSTPARDVVRIQISVASRIFRTFVMAVLLLPWAFYFLAPCEAGVPSFPSSTS